MPFGFIAHKYFKIIWLSNLMILSIPDEGYSRNASVPGFFPHRSCYEWDDKLTPCLSEIKFLDNYLMICRIVPKNIYSFGIKLFYFILEVTAMGIKIFSVSRE
jgi:hypothetical protein